MFMRKVYLTALALCLFSVTKIYAQQKPATNEEQKKMAAKKALILKQAPAVNPITSFSATKANPTLQNVKDAEKRKLVKEAEKKKAIKKS